MRSRFKFYERCLNGKILTMLTYGDSPMAEQVPPEWRGKIVHATLTAGDSTLMGADVLPEQYERPKGFHVLVGVDDPTEAERIFEALVENGSAANAAPADLLGGPFRRACGSIRRVVGD